jgi:hypothetical protein
MLYILHQTRKATAVRNHSQFSVQKRSSASRRVTIAVLAIAAMIFSLLAPSTAGASTPVATDSHASQVASLSVAHVSAESLLSTVGIHATSTAGPVAQKAGYYGWGYIKLYKDAGYKSQLDSWTMNVDCDDIGYSKNLSTGWFQDGNNASSARVEQMSNLPSCNYLTVRSQDGYTAGKCISSGNPGFNYFGNSAGNRYNDHINNVTVKHNSRCPSFR